MNKFVISKAKNGDREALNEVVSFYYQPIYRYFVRKTGNTQLALDLTQETFLRVVKSLHTYHPYKDFEAFLYTIAYHIAVDYYRKKKDIQLADEEYFSSIEMVQEEEDERCYKMRSILQQLSDKQRDCILLYYYQGLKYHQIASVLNIPLSTAKTRVRSGLRRCRQLWEETK